MTNETERVTAEDWYLVWNPRWPPFRQTSASRVILFSAPCWLKLSMQNRFRVYNSTMKNSLIILKHSNSFALSHDNRVKTWKLGLTRSSMFYSYYRLQVFPNCTFIQAFKFVYLATFFPSARLFGRWKLGELWKLGGGGEEKANLFLHWNYSCRSCPTKVEILSVILTYGHWKIIFSPGCNKYIQNWT